MADFFQGQTLPYNVWLGVTVEDQKSADQRIPFLLKVPAARRFLSCEPLLGPIDLTDITSNLLPGGPEQWNVLDRQEALEAENGAPNTIIDWVIVGGESGPKARPMHPDWARSLRDQCAAAGVPFLFKQRLDERGCKVELPALDGKVWFEFPEAAKEKAGVAAPAFPTTSRKIGEATR